MSPRPCKPATGAAAVPSSQGTSTNECRQAAKIYFLLGRQVLNPNGR
jgi:hypothetical protein